MYENLLRFLTDFDHSGQRSSSEVRSAEGFFVELKGGSRVACWVTQSVESPGDPLRSAAEDPDSLTDTTHTHTQTVTQWEQLLVFIRSIIGKSIINEATKLLFTLSAFRLTFYWSSRSRQTITSTWVDQPAASMSVGGTAPLPCSGKRRHTTQTQTKIGEQRRSG